AKKSAREGPAGWHRWSAGYRAAFPELATEFERRMRGDLPTKWIEAAQASVTAAQAVTASQATRQSSQAVLNLIGPALPELLGGSADLTPSNNTLRKDSIA